MTQQPWTNKVIRKRAREWESMAVGQANMPMSDYIEAAMREVRDDLTAQLAWKESVIRQMIEVDMPSLEAQLAAVTQERDEWRQQHADCTTALITEERKVTRVKAERDQLRQELAEWKRKALARPDWKMPEPPMQVCPRDDCDGKIEAVAYSTGEGWLLHWACEVCGDYLEDELSDIAYIDWPFHDEKIASAKELEDLGFNIV